ncbi:unnamed protein product [Caenorhabditis auriculariae]|uniref:G-protein coupled receptors family 1 profile domain-containing protein n=1 Tax=Caenorhabditis auriculariae TaxID=2777116 RepID=A0A8S1GNV1_9PELO|nr:unnamed protein product [Caenorhabditis auriculariae]
MGYLGLVILLGVPSNIIILRKLLQEQRLSHKDTVKSGFVMLKIHLNITDLLILTLALGKLMWLITYEWVGGDFLCRMFQLLSMFAMYSSSNIVVCIAVDRLRNVMYADKVRGKPKMMNPVTVLAALSWIFSFACSLPQLLAWQTFEVPMYGGWTQCTDIWQISRFGGNLTIDPHSKILTRFVENSYNILHLVLVFWGPLLVLVVCHVLIATKLMQYSLRPPGLLRMVASVMTINCLGFQTGDGNCGAEYSEPRF